MRGSLRWPHNSSALMTRKCRCRWDNNTTVVAQCPLITRVSGSVASDVWVDWTYLSIANCDAVGIATTLAACWGDDIWVTDLRQLAITIKSTLVISIVEMPISWFRLYTRCRSVPAYLPDVAGNSAIPTLYWADLDVQWPASLRRSVFIYIVIALLGRVVAAAARIPSSAVDFWRAARHRTVIQCKRPSVWCCQQLISVPPRTTSSGSSLQQQPSCFRFSFVVDIVYFRFLAITMTRPRLDWPASTNKFSFLPQCLAARCIN